MKEKINKFGYIHFIGIGGIGMSGIAELMKNLGYFVQGSDILSNSNTIRLEKKGIKVLIGHNKRYVHNVSAVIFSSAVKKNNPEILEAIKQKIPVVSRAEMLGELMRFKRGIAIAGSHGKTTTTSILANILEEAKFDPTFVNGGIVNSVLSNSKMGNGEWMVAEADESDGSFLKLPNEINIITNIDIEHLDYYKNFNKLFLSFKKFSSSVPFYGCTILCLDNKYTNKLSRQITTREVITYGIDKLNADLNIINIKIKNGKSHFTIKLSEKFNNISKRKINLSLNLLGKHNILNSSAAVAVSLKIGIKAKTIQKTLSNFDGVSRRFTFIGKVKNTKIYDDYAHHPSEILASLEIAKILCRGKIIVIFQPHRYSRTKTLYNDFIKVLKKIDVLAICNIYSAGEKYEKGLDLKFYNDIKKNSKKFVIKVKNEKNIYKYISPYLKNDNLVIFMGAGSISNLAKKFILEHRK